jgi:hypothetical protein
VSTEKNSKIFIYTLIKTLYNTFIKRRKNAMTNKKRSNCGRPAGRIKTAKIEISIEPTVKDEFMTLLRNEGKTASVEIGSWIREYIKNNKLTEEE